MTTLIVVLAILVVVPTVVIIYRVHRKVDDAQPIPLGLLAGLVVGDNRSWKHGPDSGRIAAELRVLHLQRRDSA
ncbi:hypothetical protein EF294_07100 [Gordonia oryzae]|uniref:Uncharacterized protein n=1 Tax=Gordonia oryzae TaxID=2487349 RepID=A0A3N4H0H1_9ACTN|nr:hypothetical protein [Gordonia oryzae]RPA64851.1 hypothetical protein EF294_07100 [Gordonia oryzae]